MSKYIKRLDLAASGEPDITSNYAGVEAAGYIAAAILGGASFSNGDVMVHEAVPYKMNLRNMSLGGTLMQAGSCDYSHSGTVDLTDTVITLVDLKVNIDMCKKEFFPSWEIQRMGASRNGMSLAADFTAFFVEQLGKQISWDNQRNLWDGNSGLSGAPTNFNGITKQHHVANGAAYDLNPAVAHSASTIIAEMRSVLDLVPQAVKVQPDFKLYVSRTIADFYRVAIGNSGYLDLYSVGDKPMNLDGYIVQPVDGMSAKYMIAGRASDLHFGTNLLSDMQSIQIIDREPIEGDDNVRFIMKFQCATQVTNVGDSVSYLTTG